MQKHPKSPVLAPQVPNLPRLSFNNAGGVGRDGALVRCDGDKRRRRDESDPIGRSVRGLFIFYRSLLSDHGQ